MISKITFFCSQMYLLYKDPKGKTIFAKGTSANSQGYLAANLASKMEQEELSDRITQLEQLLNKASRRDRVLTILPIYFH